MPPFRPASPRGRRSGRRGESARTRVRLGALLCTAAALLAACGSGSSRGASRPGQRASQRASTASSGAGHVTTSTAPTTTTTTAPTTSTTTTTTAPTTTTLPTNGAPLRNLPVTSVTMTFVDASRPTVSYGRTIAPSRTLPTTIFLPATGSGPWPLVVFGHGYRIGPAPYDRIASVWASAGYVVALPSFPLTDVNVAGANLSEDDMVNQPADESFLVTRLLAQSAAPAGTSALAGRIDPTRIAAAGHSDGASNALDLGYYPGVADTRLRAIVALSADPFPDRSTASGPAPLLDVHGDADSITPFRNSGTVMDQIHTRRFRLVLHGADHLPPVQGGTRWTPVLDAVTIDFLDRYLAGRTTTDQAIVADAGPPDLASIEMRLD